MPTPVSAARQCLTEEGARVLDDAVAVARRRCHAQTTSLHAVSALLAMTSSILRDACTRAGSSSYSPRLQFRALELSVGVSLDRLPTSKNLEDDPPVSNSLMAAIKRSQANQRRHPESFHLLQIQNQQHQMASFLKVELKHFVLSILDDPIVSKVFGEAGFRSCDIKLAILHPPISHASRFSRTRFPPIFLCNLTGSDTGKSSFNFPFMGSSDCEDGDENSRRIGQVLVRKTGKNPLLMGVCARDALTSFVETVKRCKVGVLPAEISGLEIVSIDKEISSFVIEDGSEEKMELKFKELGCKAEECSGPGIAVNYGELKTLVCDGASGGAVSFVVSKMKRLLEECVGKVWLLGVAGTYETYSKFLDLFPSIDKDWNLQLLPITSASPSFEGTHSKSSLIGSFVPLGGFFSTSTELTSPLSTANQSFLLCQQCTENCGQEVAEVLKGVSTALPSDYSAGLPRLQKIGSERSNGLQTNDDKSVLDVKIFGLQRKWSNICQCLHPTQQSPKSDNTYTRFKVPFAEGSRYGTDSRGSSSINVCPDSFQSVNQSHCTLKDMQDIFSSKQVLPVSKASCAVSADSRTDLAAEDTKNHEIFSATNTSQHCCISSPLSSVTTELGLGTLYTSASLEPNVPKLDDHVEHLQCSSDMVSVELDTVTDYTSNQNLGSFVHIGSNKEGKLCSGNFNSFYKMLIEKVGWQDEAIYAISQALSLGSSGTGRQRVSSFRRDIWLTFFGPDQVAKQKIASVISKTVFGNRENLIYVDLSPQRRAFPSNSVFGCGELYGDFLDFGRKAVVDYIAGELNKKPQAVVFLENVDRADPLVQGSLSQALRTGRFPDSHGREISIGNMIFVLSSTITEGNGNQVFEKEPNTFSERAILEAKKFQIRLILEGINDNAKTNTAMNVRIAPRKQISKSCSLNKRKLDESSEIKEQGMASKVHKQDSKVLRSCLDLNVPLEEVENEVSYNNYEYDPISESSKAWLDNFLNQTDERVIFKPFSFDALAGKLLKKIDLQLQKALGYKVLLEIDFEVMVQILAAAWLSDEKRTMNWIEQVLGGSFGFMKQKYCAAPQSVLKLVSGAELSVEEQAPEICLPAKINLN